MVFKINELLLILLYDKTQDTEKYKITLNKLWSTRWSSRNGDLLPMRKTYPIAINALHVVSSDIKKESRLDLFKNDDG